MKCYFCQEETSSEDLWVDCSCGYNKEVRHVFTSKGHVIIDWLHKKQSFRFIWSFDALDKEPADFYRGVFCQGKMLFEVKILPSGSPSQIVNKLNGYLTFL